MRFSIRTYLVQAKRHLQRPNRTETQTSLVVGNESADLDSIVSALIYGWIQSSRLQAQRDNDFVIPITNIPAADLALRPELTALLRHADVKPDELITLDDVEMASLSPKWTSWTLVDHNALSGVLAQDYSDRIAGVVDHHDDEGKVPADAQPRIITKSGSCSSLVVNHCREAWDNISSHSSSIGAAIAQDDSRLLNDSAYTATWSAQVAKLGLGAMLIDTNNMTSEDKVTDHDLKAVKYSEARINIAPNVGKDYDRDAFFNEMSKSKTDIGALSLRDILRKDYKEWEENGMKLGISSIVKPIEFLSSKSEALVDDLLDLAHARELKLFAVMTVYTNDSGDFARQLVLLSIEDGKPVDVAKKFSRSSSSELQLEDSQQQLGSVSGASWVHLWEQRNLAASRKRVGPLLREAMR